jgi:hypothetical protein
MTTNLSENILFDETSRKGIRTEFLRTVWTDDSGREGDSFTIRSTRPGRSPMTLSIGQHLIGPLRAALDEFEKQTRARHLARAPIKPRPPTKCKFPVFAAGVPRGGKVAPP